LHEELELRAWCDAQSLREIAVYGVYLPENPPVLSGEGGSQQGFETIGNA
jgi:hypothetical protein